MSEKLFGGDVESRKLKRRIEEAPMMDNVDSDQLLLSLSLGHNKMVGESSTNFTFKSLKGHEESSPKPIENTNHHQMMKPKQRQFSCKFCNKKFPSSQALGGHQNAHRRERVLSRMDKEFNMGTYGLGAHMCPYSPMAHQHPFRGSLPLCPGSHLHHMPHMSTMPWPNYVPGYANQFGMTNPWGLAVQNPQNLFNKDVGFGSKLNEVPSLDTPNRAIATHSAAHQGNHYAGNQQFSSSRANFSLNV